MVIETAIVAPVLVLLGVSEIPITYARPIFVIAP